MVDAKGEVLLRTKPGCYVGVRVPGAQKIFFGQMSKYDPDSNSIALSRYVVLNTDSYAVEQVVEQPVTAIADAANILLGKNLMHSVGGDDKANELLDALEHKFDEGKYRAYLHVLKEEKRIAEREKKAREKVEKAKLKPGRAPMQDVEYVARKVGRGAFILTAAYFHGYFPWAYKRLGTGDVLDIRHDGHALVNNVYTDVVNLVIFVGSTLNQANLSPDGHTYLSNPAVWVPLAMFGLSGVSLVGKGIHKGAQGAMKMYKERQEREQERRRLERLRQAFCPADKEKYYEV